MEEEDLRNMKKIEVEIIGLSHSQTESAAYALILGEVRGKRRLPVIIGENEAHSIAVLMEKVIPSRPMTHDLFKSFAEEFHVRLEEVIISNLVNGIFFAKLICRKDGKIHEIDSRTSDAVALATRFEVPIYTYEFLLSSSGVIIENDLSFMDHIDTPDKAPEVKPAPSPLPISQMSEKQLKDQLKKVVADEWYEAAAQIRDELSRRRSQ